MKFINEKTKREKIELITLSICLIIYLLIHIVLIQHHEAWRDESQAWCLAKGSSITGIVGQLSAEGHPILWFAFLYPFTHLGFKFAWLSYLTLGLSGVAACFFMFKAPFNSYIKVVILCSSIFSFFMPVVARVYALSLLVVVLIGVVYKDRHEKSIIYSLLIAMLFQTHIILAGLAIGLGLSFAYETIRNKDFNLKKKISFLIILTSFIMLGLELWQRKGDKVFLQVTSDYALSRFSIERIRDNLYDLSYKLFHFSYSNDRYLIILVYVMFLVIVASIIELIIYMVKNKSDVIPELIIDICGIGYYFAIIVFVREANHEQLAICFLIIMLLVLWICYGKVKVSYVGFNLLVLLSILSVISIAKFDYNGSYSMSKEMANYIEKNLDDDIIIYVPDEQSIGTLISYIEDNGKQVLYKSANSFDEHTFFSWKSIYPDLNEKELLKSMNEDLEVKNVYFITTEEIEMTGLNLIYTANHENKWNESYYLYSL